MQIEKQIIEEFENLCDWFIDNKLCVYFGEDKKKSILFASKQRPNNISQLNSKYKGNIKQYSEVTYLACLLFETMSGAPT